MNPRRYAVVAAVSVVDLTATASAVETASNSADRHRDVYRIRHSDGRDTFVAPEAYCPACLDSVTMLKLVVVLELVSADELAVAHKLVVERPCWVKGRLRA